MRRRLTRCVLAGVLGCVLALPGAGEAVPPLPVLADGPTVRVSTNADGSEAPGTLLDVTQPSVSANGRYVVFHTFRSLLGDCGVGTYLRDLVTGRLEFVSIAATGCVDDGKGGGGGEYTSISADGRYVAFTSGDKDLVAGRRLRERSPTGNDTHQVFVRDRARKRTVLVSEGYDGQPANASASSPTVSDDGRFVAFESKATNLVRGDRGDPDGLFRSDIFLRDLHRGVTVRVGPNIRKTASIPKINASLSGNGRYVTFDAWSSTLAPHRAGTGLDEPSDSQVYVWDRVTGKTELVSRSDDGYAANGIATLDGYVGSKISRDGRWITFTSQANNLTPHVPMGLQDPWNVFLFDRVTKKLRRVTDGLAGEGGNGESRDPCLSADGRYVSFASAASNLGAVDATPGYWRGFPDAGTDIYLYDRDTKTTRLVSKSTEGVPADLNSHESCPSNGGKAVVFVSNATTLVESDTNGVADVFVHRFD